MSRKDLLPPYLEDGPAWTQLAEAIDTVFKNRIDRPTRWVSQMRDLFIPNEVMANTLESVSDLFDEESFEIIDKEILIRQANLLGFDLAESDILSIDDYKRIVRTLGSYWFNKGTPQFINYVGFIINSVVQIKPLWSTTGLTPDSYGPFIAQGDAGIGTPVWEGGTWFPTTHFNAVFDPDRFATVNPDKLKRLIYSIANYNLVLNAIEIDVIYPIHTVDDPEIANMVVTYPLVEVIEVIESV